jgi:peptidoglycan pentaglycine glycine transferase (the first glycine)
MDKLYVAGGITVIFGDKAICLYGGSKNVLRNSTRSSHYLNYKRIEESTFHKCIWHDLSRIYMGNINERSKDYGLYLFKKSFNANEVKYIGEFTIVNNKFMYFSFTKILPLFRIVIKKIKGTK